MAGLFVGKSLMLAKPLEPELCLVSFRSISCSSWCCTSLHSCSSPSSRSGRSTTLQVGVPFESGSIAEVSAFLTRSGLLEGNATKGCSLVLGYLVSRRTNVYMHTRHPSIAAFGSPFQQVIRVFTPVAASGAQLSLEGSQFSLTYLFSDPF